MSLTETAEGHPEVIRAMATLQYNYILDLRAELDAAMGFSEEVPDLMVSFGGGAIGLGTAPLSVISSTLTKINTALRNVVGFVLNEEMPAMGRPTQVLTRAADFQFAGVKPGSIRVMLSVQDPRSLLREFDRGPLETAVGHISAVADWASSSEDFVKLRSALDDDSLTRVVLSQVQRIVPSARDEIEYVALSGRLVSSEHDIVLTRASGKRLVDAFGEMRLSGGTEVVETGRLRQVDLDTDMFHLRDRPEDKPPLRCHIPREILAQALGFMVEDAVVSLHGIQKVDAHGQPATLQVTQIEQFDS